MMRPLPQTTDSAPPVKTKTPPRRRWIGTALAGTALITGSLAIHIGNRGITERPTYQEAPAVAQPFSAADRDTYTPAATAEPAPTMPPFTVTVPSLGVSAPVTESDADASGALILPTSDKTTRYIGAAAIGAPQGSTVVAGHVNFPDGSPGALAPIAGISKGAPVYISDSVGKQHAYTVVSAETLIKTELPTSLFATSGPPQLVLITCGGPIEDTGNGILGYTHNTVVTAVPSGK